MTTVSAVTAWSTLLIMVTKPSKQKKSKYRKHFLFIFRPKFINIASFEIDTAKKCEDCQEDEEKVEAVHK